MACKTRVHCQESTLDTHRTKKIKQNILWNRKRRASDKLKSTVYEEPMLEKRKGDNNNW